MNAGENPPSRINVVIEIPRGSNVKYEIDQTTGQVFVDRFLYTATHYPFNYGFIPGTKGEDGDPLDALVLTEEPVYPTSIVRSRTIGALLMEDEEGSDVKIVAVPDRRIDPTYASITTVRQLSDFTRKQIEHFFVHYKESEPGKFVKMGRWQGRSPAEDAIRRALVAFERDRTPERH